VFALHNQEAAEKVGAPGGRSFLCFAAGLLWRIGALGRGWLRGRFKCFSDLLLGVGGAIVIEDVSFDDFFCL